MTGPYASAADGYWSAGWRGILPLPPKAKANPPAGYTGGSGADPSYADVFTWANSTEGAGNIALRLPRNVIGLDVDNYGDKNGAETLDLAIAQYGPLPPTWRTTSRDDGVSGIRLYRVPEGLAWPGELGAATEIIQHGHRYAVVCPSLHPEGRTYRWVNPAGVTSTAIPDPDELPLLPTAWVEGLTGGALATETARNTLGTKQSAEWLVVQPGAMAEPCHRMRKVIDQANSDLLGSAHVAARDGALRAVRLASEGHPGVVTALADIKRLFTAEATSANRDLLGKRRRTAKEAQKEWDDAVTSAVNLVTANPTGAMTCDCHGQLTAAIVGGAGLQVAGSNALAPQVEPAPLPSPAVQETAPAEASARLRDGASFILDAPDGVPTVWGDGDEVLWAQGEALMLVGPPGVGKTTLTGQVVRARLGLARDVLGMTVEPSERHVLYLAMDRPRQIARALRRTFHDSDRDVLAERLRVWEGPPPGDVARNTDILVALASMADADTLVVDSLKDAAIGLSEDEVAAGYNRARQKALAAGIQVLELHHVVKRGPNGSKPNTLADVYGSAWLTAGVGSVLLVWGAAGDLVVEATHLKQPASEVGPMKVLHDHVHGTSSIFHATDVLQIAIATGTTGITAKAVARAMFEKDKPTDSEVHKARRRLDKLVEAGELERLEVADGRPQVTWRQPRWGGSLGGSGGFAGSEGHFSSQDVGGVRATLNKGGSQGGSGGSQAEAAQPLRTPPPPKEGGVVGEPEDHDKKIPACRTCGQIVDSAADLTRGGECRPCGREG